MYGTAKLTRSQSQKVTLFPKFQLKISPIMAENPPSENSRNAINKLPTAECGVKVKTHTSVRKRMHLSLRLIDYFFQTKSGV